MDSPPLPTPRGPGRLGWVCSLGLGLALVGALLVALPGPLNRLGLLHFRTGFAAMQYGAYAALAGLGLCAIGLALALAGPARGMAGRALVGLLVAAAAFGAPAVFRSRARAVPPIHDISTDLERPPAFVAVLPLRADAPNPPAHGGPELARQQREAYPDLQPLLLPVGRDEAFRRALEAAHAEGWEVVAAEPAEGRIEATDTTFWWGFKDDVVVRVSERGPVQSVVDARSVSRVGKSDVGKNAARLRAYLARLKAD